jgi:hypothetical protein
MKYIEENKAKTQYDELLDECYPTVKVCGYDFSPSYALKELDPIAYRCGFGDWLDSENLTTYEDEADEEENDEEDED